MQEILYQIITGVNVESEESRLDIRYRIPFMEIEASQLFPGGIHAIESSTPPRLMKSHLSARFFENQLQTGNGKFIVVMRNVKDNLVSFYNLYRMVNCFEFNKHYGTWNEFFEMFKAKVLLHGDWLDFNLSWWELREHVGNVLIVKYEDMKKDLKANILKVANFVGKSLSKEQVNSLANHVTFEAMKNNDAVNYTKRCPPHFRKDVSFMNKGTVGNWTSAFTLEQNKYVEEMYVRVAEKHGLLFDYQE